MCALKTGLADGAPIALIIYRYSIQAFALRALFSVHFDEIVQVARPVER